MRVVISGSKILFFLLTCFLFGCKKKDSSKVDVRISSERPLVADDSIGEIMTIAYRGILKSSSSDSLGIGTIVLKTIQDANEGSYTFSVDFGKNRVMFGGEEISTFKNHGKYTYETNDEFGDLYIMKGDSLPSSEYLYFKPMANVLLEVDKKKENFTGVQLTQILSGDTIKTRNEVLKAHK